MNTDAVMKEQDARMKKAPANFDDEEEEDVGDIDEGADKGQKNLRGNYQTQVQRKDEHGKGMVIEQRGAMRKQRSSSAKRRKNSTGSKRGKQMANKSYASSELGADESHGGFPEGGKDFNSAYAKLVEKIYLEQGNTLLVSQEEIQKLEHLKTLNEEDFRSRISEFEDKKRRKIQQMQDEEKEKELVGCTFHPQIHSQQDGEQKRSMDQFLEDQKKFLEKVKRKNEETQLQTSQANVSTMIPTIDETSRKIIEEKMGERNSKPTYERLYDLNKEKMQKQAQNVMKSSPARKEGNPNVSRRPDLDQTLYDDAKRRREENAHKKQELDKVRDMPKEKMYVNEKSDKYVIKRFDKELKQVEQELFHEQGKAEGVKKSTGNYMLNYETMCTLLTAMGFLPQNKAPEPIEQQLCQDLWTLTKGDQNQGVTMDTLRVVLLNVIGIRIPEREKTPDVNETQMNETNVGDEAAERPNINMEKLGLFDELKKFHLKTGGHSRVFAHFKNLYVNKVQFVGSQKKFSKAYVQPDANFQSKPEISEKTAEMAMNKRKKLHGNAENVNLVEILLHPGGKGEWLENQKKEKEQKEIEGCTFKPQTLEYNTGTRNPTHGDKCLDLFSRATKGCYKDKKMKSVVEQEFEKNGQEYTFAPKINEENSIQEEAIPVSQIKGVDKVMERLQKARELQMQKKLMTERGMPSQLQATLGKPEPTMNFGSNTNKFKSGFGINGSSIIPTRNSKVDFAVSQKINKSELIPRSRGRNIARGNENRNNSANIHESPDDDEVTASQTINIQQQPDEIEQHIQKKNFKVQQNQNPTDQSDQNNSERLYSQEEEEENQEYDNNGREPMLFVDVNLGSSGNKRIVVYEGDTAEGLAENFANEYKLDLNMKQTLIAMLQEQISNSLARIDEEQHSSTSDAVTSD